MKKMILIWMLLSSSLYAEELHLAVAANFTLAMEKIKTEFEKNSEHRLTITSGSTAKLFAQIKAKAPFDMFFSADNHYTQKMIDEKLALAEGRLIYAQGKLVLYSKNQKFSKDFSLKDLSKMNFKFIALANPELAPYGKAAMEALAKVSMIDKLQPKMVIGESIAKTFHYLSSNNSELGFIALSQVMNENKDNIYIVPQEMYAPLLQEVVIVAHSKKKAVSVELLNFLQTPKIKEFIKTLGYD